jgi:hypothetical protein
MVATVQLDRKIKLEGGMREKVPHNHKRVAVIGTLPVIHIWEVMT